MKVHHPGSKYSSLGIGRATLACLTVILLVFACVRPGMAQKYPSKPIRLVLPYPAGTGTDIIARVIGQELAERLGHPVVTDNRPGGASLIGFDIVAKASPDGHTLLVAAPSLTIAPALHESLPFDVLKDFAPVMRVTSAPLVLIVNPALQVSTVKEFVALARAKPGQLNFASGGIGGSIHMGMELLNSVAGIKVTHVAYKGSPQALIDLLSGQVHSMTNIISSSLPHIASGKLKALGVTGPTRISVLPAVPTIAEAGVPGYEVLQWHGFLAPAGTPSHIVKLLEGETRRIMGMQSIKESLSKQGFEPASDGPDEFAKLLKVEVGKWRKVVRDSGTRIN
jgi:tripartite-type tricarboxylate transporter receptor subunit TctC